MVLPNETMSGFSPYNLGSAALRNPQIDLSPLNTFNFIPAVIWTGLRPPRSTQGRVLSGFYQRSHLSYFLLIDSMFSID